jgi:hypothetical protein
VGNFPRCCFEKKSIVGTTPREDLFGRFKVISVNLYDPFVVREKYYAKK